MGSNGSQLSSAPLADRDLSPQARDGRERDDNRGTGARICPFVARMAPLRYACPSSKLPRATHRWRGLQVWGRDDDGGGLIFQQQDTGMLTQGGPWAAVTAPLAPPCGPLAVPSDSHPLKLKFTGLTQNLGQL